MTVVFQYAVVRYVPDVVRDEALNVGVIVRSIDGGEFTFRFLPRSSSVRRLWPGSDRMVIRHLENQLGPHNTLGQLSLGEVKPLPGIGLPHEAEFFARACDQFNGTLQLTQPRGLTSDTLPAALAWAYRTFVAEPDTGSRPVNYQAMAPSQLRERLWSAFQRKHLIAPGRVSEKFVLDGRHSPWTFDLGYSNGAVHVINSIALTSKVAETNLGRALLYRGMIEEVLDKAQGLRGIAVVQSQSDEQAPGAREATAILDDADIEVVGFGEMATLVSRVERDLAQHLAPA